MDEKSVETRAAELFDEGLYCAESVLMAVAEAAGCANNVSPGIATGFCSGVARSAGPCGAVSGAIMALGLTSGRVDAEQSVEKNYAQVQQLLEQFSTQFGSCNCADLLGCHLGTEEGQAQFRERNLGKRCREYTITAAGIAGKIIQRSK